MAQPGLLRTHRGFRLLFCGRTVSLFGDRFSLLALPILALREADATPGQVALLFAVQALPGALLAVPVAAHLVGRSERATMIACDLVRAFVLLTLFALAGRDALTLWQLLIAVGVVGLTNTVFSVASQSYIPRLIDRADYAEANSRFAQANSVADVAGPVLAGSLIGFAGADVAVLIDATSFLLSLLFLVGLRVAAIAELPPEPLESGLWARLRDGIGFVVAHRGLQALIGATALFNLGGAMIGSLWYPYLLDRLDFSPRLIGLLTTVGGISALGAALMSRRIVLAVQPGILLTTTLCTVVVAVWLVPVAGLGHPALLLAGYQFMFSAAVVYFYVAAGTVRQLITPLDYQGRVFAVAYTFSLVSIPAGGALASLAAGLWSQATGILVGAVVASTSLLAVPALARLSGPGAATAADHRTSTVRS